MEEINQLFDQVDLKKWYPHIKDYTFKTEFIPLSQEETLLVQKMNKFYRYKKQIEISQTEEQFLKSLKEKLNKVISGFLSKDQKPAAFVKFSDRSPKDAQDDFQKIHSIYQNRVEFLKKSNQIYSNLHLQAYVWSKARSLIVHNADEAFELFFHSEIIESDLEMRDPEKEMFILVREWVDLDPAFEYRTFITNNKMVGLSQMATHDVILHYPQILERKQELTLSANQFFEQNLSKILDEVVTKKGPSNKYVLDLYRDESSKKWYVIELNPFETSSSGHLFNFYKDNQVLNNGPLQGRFHQQTPKDSIKENIHDQRWVEILTQTSDVFGVNEEEFLKNYQVSQKEEHKENIQQKQQQKNFDKTFVLISSGGHPNFNKDTNEKESIEWVSKTHSIFSQQFKIPQEKIYTLCFNDTELKKYPQAQLSNSENFIKYLDQISQETRKLGGNCSIFINHIGHGKRDAIDWNLEPIEVAEGVFGIGPQIDPASTRAWFTFPQASSKNIFFKEEVSVFGEKAHKVFCEGRQNGVMNYDYTDHILHWQTLAIALHNLCYAVPQNPNRILFFSGTCFSASMFSYLELHSPADKTWGNFGEKERSKMQSQLADCLVAQTLYSSQEQALQAIKQQSLAVITSSNRDFPVSTWCWDAYVQLIKENKSFCEIIENIRKGVNIEGGERPDPYELISPAFLYFLTENNKLMISQNIEEFLGGNNQNNQSQQQSGGLAQQLQQLELQQQQVKQQQQQVKQQYEPNCLVFFGGGASIKINYEQLISKCGDLQQIQKQNDKLNLPCDSKSGLQIIDFILDENDFRQNWEPLPSWQSILEIALNNGWFDLVEQLVKWREDNQKESGSMKGDFKNVIVPGWLVKQTNMEQQKQNWENCLGWAFECEGNGLQIMNYYRLEGMTDEEWQSLTLFQRFQKINGNWAQLKVKIKNNVKNLKQFEWMNQQLTIEDAGFLWEVSYGGKTPGYTIDPEYMIDEIYEVAANGLTATEREMDSGIQVHASFPFFRGESSRIQQTILCFMVHLDDFISLRSFERSVIDDCNNMWLNSDLNVLIESLKHGEQALRGHVSPAGGGEKHQPNPRFKHKHIGLRAADCYSQKFGIRYGFELRRGSLDEEQLAELIRFISYFFTRLGQDGKEDIEVKISTKSRGKRQEGSGYSSKQLCEFVQNVRDSSDQGFNFKKQHSDQVNVDPDKLKALAQHWTNQMIQWEYHLRKAKQLIWKTNKNSVIKRDEEFEVSASIKIESRLGFVLNTDWRKFPSPLNENGNSKLGQIFFEEQQHIRNEIGSIYGLKQIKEEQSQVALEVNETKTTELRFRLADFARRLSHLY